MSTDYKDLIIKEAQENPDLAELIITMLVKWFPVYSNEDNLKDFVEFYNKEGYFLTEEQHKEYYGDN